MKERLSLTPGTLRFTARRLENPEDKVNPEDHEIYRSGVGTHLYLTKHSSPDICNPVRELSKTMDAPAPVYLKEMYKVIRHVLSTKGYPTGCLTTVQQVTEPNTLTSEHHLSKNIKKMEKSSSNL